MEKDGLSMNGDREDYIEWLEGLWNERLEQREKQRPELSIGILLWPSFPLTSLTGIVEPLRHVADFSDNSNPLYCRWAIMGQGATASCGIKVDSNSNYINPTDFDYIAVIGGLLPQIDQGPSRHRDYLRAAVSCGVPVIGVCTGVYVLGQEGLLSKQKSAIHPFHESDFRMAFPRNSFSTRDAYLESDGVFSVPGGISVMSLLVELVRKHCGPDRAAKAIHQLSLTGQRQIDSFALGRGPDFLTCSDSRIQKAIVLIEGCKGKDISPTQAASSVGMSSRQFTRLFRRDVGLTPKRFILETRLRFGLFLVETSSKTITDIAHKTGFSDSAHFATAFREKFGLSPRDARTGRTTLNT
jgi:transcriptional regulator GlxA family with amidase domain